MSVEEFNEFFLERLLAVMIALLGNVIYHFWPAGFADCEGSVSVLPCKLLIGSEEVLIVDEFGWTAFEPFHGLGHGQGFGDAEEGMDVVFDAACSDDMYFAFGGGCGEDSPDVLFDGGMNQRFAVFCRPDTVVEEFGEGAGHSGSVERKRSLRGAELRRGDYRGLKPPG